MKQVPVLIAGGGPVGMTLARTLAHLGVRCLMVERNGSTTRHPKMDITNGRSMEAEARTILLEALDRSPDADLTWIEQLMAAGQRAGGVDLPEIDDEPATAADFGA